MSVEFTSQELWQIGIFVFGAFFIICLPIIIPLLSGLWDKFYDCCSDIDRTFQNFSLITLWYELLINLKIISLEIYNFLLKCFIFFIEHPITFVFLILTIIISYSYPTVIIYRLLPVFYLLLLFIFVFVIEYKKEDKDKNNMK